MYRLAGGVHRGDDIFLVIVSQSYEGICSGDTLLLENLMLSAVSQDNLRFRELFAQMTAARLIDFNDFHLHPHVDQLLGQIKTDPSAADNHDRANLVMIQSDSPAEGGDL